MKEEAGSLGEYYHRPVLLPEVLELLSPPAGGRVVDATVGGGGHAAALLRAVGSEGLLLGLDRDPAAVAAARTRLGGIPGRQHLVKARFSALATVAARLGVTRVEAVLFDLGVSSYLLDTPARGFSFQTEGPLDMRLDPSQPLTAGTVVNEYSEERLRRLLREWGEEPQATRIARTIRRARAREPLETTGQLARLVREAAGGRRATKTLARVFQALRIVVNDELEELGAALTPALELLAPGGKLAVISYHSLEDRVVKDSMRSWGGTCRCPPRAPVCRCSRRRVARSVTPRPVRPSAVEVAQNPRARSARLRVAERL